MRTMEKIVVGVAVAVALFLGFMAVTSQKSVGGSFNSVIVDFAQGISVSGTQVISNLRALTATSGTFSTTLGVTGATTVSTFTQGGGITATTTTSTTATLLASDFDTENVLDVTPGGASLTLTLPATSTLTSFIPTAGQVRSIFIRNATTTAGINITVAGGAGTILRTASSTAIIQSGTAGATGARLDFVRRTSGDISVFFIPYNL